MARTVKPAGKTTSQTRESRGPTMHQSGSEWSLLSLFGRATNDADRPRGGSGGLGPFLFQGKPTPRSPGRGRRS